MNAPMTLGACLTQLMNAGIVHSSGYYLALSVARIDMAKQALDRSRPQSHSEPHQGEPSPPSPPYYVPHARHIAGAEETVFGFQDHVSESAEALLAFERSGLVALLTTLTHTALQMGHTKLPLDEDPFKRIFHADAMRALAERGERNQTRDRGMGVQPIMQSAGQGQGSQLSELDEAQVDEQLLREIWEGLTYAIKMGHLRQAAGQVLHIIDDPKGPTLPAPAEEDRAPLTLTLGEQGSWLALDRAWIAERELHSTLRAGQCAGEDSQAPLFPLSEPLLTTCYEHIKRRLATTQGQGSYFAPKGDQASLDVHSRFAAFAALTHPISYIHGGPGTGKTTLAQRILAILLELQKALNEAQGEQEAQGRQDIPPLRIAITAPTGKAAVRVREAIYNLDTFYPLEEETKTTIKSLKIAGVTLHRLLRFHPDRPHRLAYSSQSPLPYDVLIVDEASMLDLPLTRALCRALPNNWGQDPQRPIQRLIILGDPDQLPPVGEGAVWRDLCRDSELGVSTPIASGEPIPLSSRDETLLSQLCPDIRRPTTLTNRVSGASAQLKINYRIAAQTEANAQENERLLAELFDYVKNGQATEAVGLIERCASSDESPFSWIQIKDQVDIKTANRLLKKDIQSLFCEGHHQAFEAWFKKRKKGVKALREAIHKLATADEARRPKLFHRVEDAFKEELILCAQYKGPFGVEYFNQELGKYRLYLKGGSKKAPKEALKWRADPILILQNHTKTSLYNGDVGFRHYGVEQEDLGYFEGLSDSEEKVRCIASGRLPNYSNVYAMSIHKSQGSEFNEVTIALPCYPSPLLTRELFYTAITRTKKKIRLIASREALMRTIQDPAWRYTIGS